LQAENKTHKIIFISRAEKKFNKQSVFKIYKKSKNVNYTARFKNQFGKIKIRPDIESMKRVS